MWWVARPIGMPEGGWTTCALGFDASGATVKSRLTKLVRFILRDSLPQLYLSGRRKFYGIPETQMCIAADCPQTDRSRQNRGTVVSSSRNQQFEESVAELHTVVMIWVTMLTGFAPSLFTSTSTAKPLSRNISVSALNPLIAPSCEMVGLPLNAPSSNPNPYDPDPFPTVWGIGVVIS